MDSEIKDINHDPALMYHFLTQHAGLKDTSDGNVVSKDGLLGACIIVIAFIVACKLLIWLA